MIRGTVAKPPWRFSLAALLVMVTAQSALADNVEFTTSGAFSGPKASGAVLGSTNVKTGLTGTSTLTYFGETAGSAPADGIVHAISLGSFTLSGAITLPKKETDSFDGGFTLTINQTQPTGGSGSDTSTVTGTVIGSNGTLGVLFDTGSITIGSALYSIEDVNFFAIGNQTVSGTVIATPVARPAAVPVPAAAWGGMALFGVLGGAKVRRRRRRMDDLN